MNTTNPTSNVPAGATAYGWDSVDPDGIPVRSLEWVRHNIGKGNVAVNGWQDANGAITRGIAFCSMVGVSQCAPQRLYPEEGAEHNAETVPRL